VTRGPDSQALEVYGSQERRIADKFRHVEGKLSGIVYNCSAGNLFANAINQAGSSKHLEKDPSSTWNCV
jgi:hypothetical protein